MKRIAVAILAVSLAACTAHTIPLGPYTPMGRERAVGTLHVVDVTYVPAESGAVTPSQIFHSNQRFVINLPETVAARVRRALEAEIQHSGLSNDLKSPFGLTCRVTRVGIHQFAFGIDSVFAGELALVRPDGTLVFKMPIDLKRNHGFGTTLTGVGKDIDSMIAEAYDLFVAVQTVRAALQP